MNWRTLFLSFIWLIWVSRNQFGINIFCKKKNVLSKLTSMTFLLNRISQNHITLSSILMVWWLNFFFFAIVRGLFKNLANLALFTIFAMLSATRLMFAPPKEVSFRIETWEFNILKWNVILNLLFSGVKISPAYLHISNG